MKFDGKLLIFFDTETTGLEPNNSYEQLTQIAAAVVDGSTWNVVERINEYVSLTDATIRVLNDPTSPEASAYQDDTSRWMRKYKKPYMHPREVMQLTRYDATRARTDEKSALIRFEELLAKYPTAILVAHSAVFDMKVVAARRRANGLPRLNRRSVVDTLKIARFFLVPVLQVMESSDWAGEMLTALRAKTKYKSYSVTLQKLAAAYKVQIDDWHDAEADVQILVEIANKMIATLVANVDLDISKFQKIQGKRYRKF